jgi:Putative bacterial sensory transduction regulator
VRAPTGFRPAPKAVLTAVLASLAMALSASAQTLPSAERVRGGMLDASDPPGLARFMEKTGYRVELGAGPQGDPVITGRISRTDYLIQFYECESGAFCNSVQFLAQAARPAGFTPETANSFNARWRYVRLTQVEDQVRLQMDVNLDAGVTADNLEDTLDIWRQLLEIFEREVLGLR